MTAPPRPTTRRTREESILVLQGGGALGAYQAGVYEALQNHGETPDWVAGISIGAINAALIAGNPPERCVERLREFWELVTEPTGTASLALAGFDRSVQNRNSALMAAVFGAPGFFAPRVPPAPFQPPGSVAAISYYDTDPLRATLERLVDFDRVNTGGTRLSVGAVNVRTGNFAYFDTANERLDARHVMASGALPPGFPPIEIDGEFYWDGGLVSNTPLEYVLDSAPRRDTLALQVDLWSARGQMPRTLGDALERQKDIQYSSRTRRGTDSAAERQRLRLALGELVAQLPGKRMPPQLHGAFDAWICTKVLNVVHLIYQAKSYEEQYKDYAFGPLATSEHWGAGLADMQRTLAHPRYFALPSRDAGVVTHDIHR